MVIEKGSSRRGAEQNCNCCQPCIACSNVMQRFSKQLFGGLGATVAKFPLIVITISFVVVGVCAAGMMFFKIDNRVKKLYIPPESKAMKDFTKAVKHFPSMDPTLEEIIVIPKSGDNILTRNCFLDLITLHNEIISLQDFDKYCLKLDNKCVYDNPLQLFNFDEKNVYNITQRITQYYNTPSFRMRNGRPLVMNFGRIFGKAVWNKGVLQSAAAVQMQYLVSSSDDEYQEILNLEDAIIKKIFELKDLFTCTNIYFSTGRSLSDAITESTLSDIVLISVTFPLMIMFACCAMIKFRNPLTGHALLANIGILAIGLGILAGLGLSMFFGIPFISLVGILPFLILGIGIDDIFIIVDELDRIDVSHRSVIDNVRFVMAHSGASITMTTLTDLVAFAVGTTTKFPAIRYFCIFAALSITFVYLMIVTFFVAFMSLDVRRIKAGRRDFVLCLKVPPVKKGQPSWTTPYRHVSSRFMEGWGRVLMYPAVRAVVVVLSLALLGVSIYYAWGINEEFDESLLAKKGNYFLDFLNMREKYYPITIPVSIIVDTNIKYDTNDTQDAILKLSTIAAQNQYYMNTTISWMESFHSFASKARLSTVGANFMPSLKTFLNVPSFAFFNQDVILSKDNSSIVASRVICYMKSIGSSVRQKDAMLSLRKDLEDKSGIGAYASTKFFIFLEQYTHIIPETTMNIGLAGTAVFFITLPFLQSLTATLIVCLGFGALICELFALMYFWDVPLNMISAVFIVLAIGFSVDYSAHVAHAYLMSTKRKPEDRAIEALSTTGASVLMGGTSTFLGIAATAFASSELFRILFKLFVGVITLGLSHGLCFVPVYLSLLYRWTPVKVQDQPQESTSSLDEIVSREVTLHKSVPPIFSVNITEEKT